MRVTCHSCGAKYTIADDKVKGRRVKVRCKGCGTPIVVDGAQPGEEAAAGASQSVVPPEKLPFERESQLPQEPFVAGDTWSVNLSETEQRDMTTDEIVSGWRAGTVTMDAFVWKDGMADWLPVEQVPELAALIAPVAAPTPAPSPKAPIVAPAPAPKPVAARVAPRATADLFGAVDNAGREEESAAPPAVAAAGGAGTGARNESSVLFSLDALKAGRPAPPPTKKKDNARNALLGAPADDPFGMNLGGGGGVAGMGGGALFGGSAQSLLTAPAPEPPKPAAVVAALPVANISAMGAGYDAPPQKKSKLGLIVGGAIAAIALIGGAVFFMGGSKDGGATASSTPVTETKPEKKPEAETKPEAKPEEKPAEEKPAESATPAASAAASAAPAVAAGTPAKPGTGTAKPAEDKPAAPAADSGEPFNKGAAIAALGAAAAQAASCKKPGGPTGSGKAIITFAPSGRVTSANVDGPPFGGTPTGGCIASVFRRARVPAFSGSAVKVGKSFSVN